MTAVLPKDDEFAATAASYFHRPGSPPLAIQWIADRLDLDGQGRLLDVGCGTGHVCIPLATRFSATVGIDPSRSMLDEAEAVAASRSISSIEFRQMRAEDLPGALGSFRLITFGASFHRTDRDRVADTAYDMLEAGGGLALLFPSTPWRGDPGWKAELRAVIEHWTGRQVGGPFEPSQNVIRRSRFGSCEERDFREAHVWTTLQIVGYMKSTSLCSPRALADRMEAFERDLVARLLKVQPDGLFQDFLETTVVLAIRENGS